MTVAGTNARSERRIKVLFTGPRVVSEALCRVMAGDAVLQTDNLPTDGMLDVRAVVDRAPDVLVLCAGSAGSAALWSLPRLLTARPLMKVLVLLLASVDPRLVTQAVSAGVAGCLTERASLEEVRQAIRRVYAGQSLFTPDLVVRMGAPPAVPRPVTPLAPREAEVLQLLAEGLATDELAAQLGITIHTVRAHLKNAMAKLQAHSKTEAVLAAIRANFITLPD